MECKFFNQKSHMSMINSLVLIIGSILVLPVLLALDLPIIGIVIAPVGVVITLIGILIQTMYSKNAKRKAMFAL